MTNIEEHLSREILRKLRLAVESETKEDREIICEEVFCDVTGLLDTDVQTSLGVNGPCCFYEVLSQYYLASDDSADALLYLCRKLWGQEYAAPIYAVLLHKWLLLKSEAGGVDQRLKHVNVLVLGARQLFIGDVHSGATRFEPLYRFLCLDFVMKHGLEALFQLPVQARAAVLSCVAAFLPYYVQPHAVKATVSQFPSVFQDVRGSSDCTEFVLTEISDMLHKIKAETGLLKYLRSLEALGGWEHLHSVSLVTKLKLQSELYSLTSPGGPHYAPKTVRAAAFRTLDMLYPMGKSMRRFVRVLFRLFHPVDWLGDLWLTPVHWWIWIYGKICLLCFFALYRIVVWRPGRKGS